MKTNVVALHSAKRKLSELPTPRTLSEAIDHAIETQDEFESLEESIRRHVVDFIAQKFQIAFLKGGRNFQTMVILKETWGKISNG